MVVFCSAQGPSLVFKHANYLTGTGRSGTGVPVLSVPLPVVGPEHSESNRTAGSSTGSRPGTHLLLFDLCREELCSESSLVPVPDILSYV